jgi:hypothetical protein
MQKELMTMKQMGASLAGKSKDQTRRDMRSIAAKAMSLDAGDSKKNIQKDRIQPPVPPDAPKLKRKYAGESDDEDMILMDIQHEADIDFVQDHKEREKERAVDEKHEKPVGKVIQQARTEVSKEPTTSGVMKEAMSEAERGLFESFRAWLASSPRKESAAPPTN